MTRWHLDEDDVCKHPLVWITHKQQHPSVKCLLWDDGMHMHLRW